MDIADLQSIAGPDNVLTGTATVDYSVSGVAPSAVVAPGTREEAAAVILHAAERGWAIVPFGAGTQMSLGNRPARYDLALSTRRMNRIVDYQPDDMTVTLEPGVPMAELQTLLAGRGQFLPLNPPLPERSTAGGTVAAAGFGSWSAAHGTPRDWLIGCRVVGVDGKEIRAGGLVVKNVAGYDLPKLYTGSFGTLGLITEITFKVLPHPGVTGFCLVDVQTAEQTERLLAEIRDSDLHPSALELTRAAAGGWRVLAEFLHVTEAVHWQVDRLAAIAAQIGASFCRLSPENGEQLLAQFRDAPAMSPFAARIGTVSSRVAEVADRAVKLGDKHGHDIAIVAHAAHGRVHILAPTSDTALCVSLRSLAAELRATCQFPRLPDPLIGHVDPWGTLGPELRLMQAVKTVYDPKGTFCPGRFVGGI